MIRTSPLADLRLRPETELYLGVVHLGRARRLAKDCEAEDLYSEAMVYLASIGSLLRRLAPSPATATRAHTISAAA